MTLRHWAVAGLVLAMAGCGSSKPEIKGFHWRNGFVVDTLYNSQGIETATVVGGFIGISSQACIFDAGAGFRTDSCMRFETSQEAFDWVGKEFGDHAK